MYLLHLKLNLLFREFFLRWAYILVNFTPQVGQCAYLGSSFCSCANLMALFSEVRCWDISVNKLNPIFFPFLLFRSGSCSSSVTSSLSVLCSSSVTSSSKLLSSVDAPRSLSEYNSRVLLRLSLAEDSALIISFVTIWIDIYHHDIALHIISK